MEEMHRECGFAHWVLVTGGGDAMTEAITIVAALAAAFVLVQYWLPRHK
jgi:hypothetical protein